ncbi:MAG: hypothetical protein QOF62_2849 [Pyrinomonadaceae bacterium]|jgi:hypothetical protein|nr:hypothetical protein [Pyrinomonadaceae bacterium]
MNQDEVQTEYELVLKPTSVSSQLVNHTGPSPLVTVIVPAYNYGRFIPETLRSVQAQSYQFWECIVVDDGSTDETGNTVRSFSKEDPRIKYIRQDNQGLAAARNTGIRKASGEYFQFLDADDLLEPHKFERQVRFLEQHSHVDIVFGDARYFHSEHPEERLFSPEAANEPWVATFSAKGQDVLLSLVRNNIMVVSSPVLRRSVIDDVGLFENSTKGIEDWHYWLRCAAEGKHFHYDASEGTQTLVRVHGNSMSTDARMMLRSTLLLHQKVAEMINDPAVLQVNTERMIEREGLLGVEEIAAGELLAGMRQLCKAAVMDRSTRHRAKWIFCAVAAPFVSTQQLRKLVSTPVLQLAGGASRRWARRN